MIENLTPQERAQLLKSFVRSEPPLNARERQSDELLRLTSTNDVQRIQLANYFSRKVKR